LTKAKAKDPGWHYFELMAITFSALALEALANSFGEHLIHGWKDYESASPIAKLRIVCDFLKIEIDFEREPWFVVKWLIKFRNKVAHAKPQQIRTESIMTDAELEAVGREMPESEMEKEISLHNAERSFATVENILAILYGKLDPYDDHNLLADGWSGSSTKIQEPTPDITGGMNASPA
jgi:hypothetical protein